MDRPARRGDETQSRIPACRPARPAGVRSGPARPQLTRVPPRHDPSHDHPSRDDRPAVRHCVTPCGTRHQASAGYLSSVEGSRRVGMEEQRGAEQSGAGRSRTERDGAGRGRNAVAVFGLGSSRGLRRWSPPASRDEAVTFLALAVCIWPLRTDTGAGGAAAERRRTPESRSAGLNRRSAAQRHTTSALQPEPSSQCRAQPVRA